MAHPHGSRTTYQVDGCRCQPCRQANARYLHDLRKRKLRGKIILGAIISAAESRRLLNQLHREQVQRGDVAHALGLKVPQVKVYQHITVRKALKIKRLHRMWMSEEASA